MILANMKKTALFKNLAGSIDQQVENLAMEAYAFWVAILQQNTKTTYRPYASSLHPPKKIGPGEYEITLSGWTSDLFSREKPKNALMVTQISEHGMGAVDSVSRIDQLLAGKPKRIIPIRDGMSRSPVAFRMVSNSQKGTGKWAHPGSKAKNLHQRVLDFINKRISQIKVSP